MTDYPLHLALAIANAKHSCAPFQNYAERDRFLKQAYAVRGSRCITFAYNEAMAAVGQKDTSPASDILRELFPTPKI